MHSVKKNIFLIDHFHSFLISFTFLTCINIPKIKINFDKKNIQNSLVFYPVIGLFFGLLLLFTAGILFRLKVYHEIISFIILALPFFLNKFLHFDGLSDTMDAFLSDRKPRKRLKIMKDPNIGSFALGVIILFVLLKFISINIFLSLDKLIILIVIIPVISRFCVVLLAFISKYPRKKGTAKDIIGKISGRAFIYASIMLMLILTIYSLIAKLNATQIIISILAIIYALIFTLIFRLYSYKKIGGVTGDVLGALNEFIELLLFLTFIFYK
jgi:adenosylcobinamide-GDP ribazoletransferase